MQALYKVPPSASDIAKGEIFTPVTSDLQCYLVITKYVLSSLDQKVFNPARFHQSHKYLELQNLLIFKQISIFQTPTIFKMQNVVYKTLICFKCSPFNKILLISESSNCYSITRFSAKVIATASNFYYYH